MDWTDRHCRAFHRTLSARALLYTEMITAAAVLRGDRARLLGFSPAEHPVALQLGGSDPQALAAAALVGEDFGYDEINLNVGCPSDRVQTGRFGACLMRDPQLVADCMGAIAAAVSIPVTVKCRIGVDDQDPQDSLWTLVELCIAAGVETFIVHARKAWLQGLSPKENRDIPPLNYPLVQKLKQTHPDVEVILNGGILNLDEAMAHLSWADGVMLGRAAYMNPALLAQVDQRVFGDIGGATVLSAVELHRGYLADRLAEGVPLNAMTRHMLGLFGGQPGARAWRRILSVNAAKPGAGLEVLDAALRSVALRDHLVTPDRLQALALARSDRTG